MERITHRALKVNNVIRIIAITTNIYQDVITRIVIIIVTIIIKPLTCTVLRYICYRNHFWHFQCITPLIFITTL